MAYGVKIELIGQSAIFKKNWKVQILKKDYIGAVTYRNVPAASPFAWKKDAAETVRGTSFQFLIRAISDFEFIDLYTCDAKEYKVILLYADPGSLVYAIQWIGFLLPEQYQETYKPAPNIISFSATDGLGLLKEIKYSSPSTPKTLLQIINECLAYTEIGIGYCISIAIQETRQNFARSVLSEIKKDASTYNDKSYYDVIASILGTYLASITQQGARWFIVDSLKTANKLYYDATGVFESDAGPISINVLGQLGNTGTTLYPLGSPLDFSMATSYKNLKITSFYGTKVSMLPPSGKDDWITDTILPGWNNGSVTFPIEKIITTTDYFIRSWDYATYSAPFARGVQIAMNVEATTEDLVFSIDFSQDYAVPTVTFNMYFKFTLVSGSTTWYLTPTGWQQTPGYFTLPNIPLGSLANPAFVNFKTTFTGFPISGALTIYASTPENGIPYDTGILLKNASLSQLNGGAVQSAGITNNVTLNQSPSAGNKEIELTAADLPGIANATLIFKNYMTLLDGRLTQFWQTGSIASTSLFDLLTKLYASDNRKAKQLLRGTIRGAVIDPGSIVRVNYPYVRDFEFLEFSYDLIADVADVTLSEILPYQDAVFTIVSEPASESTSKTQTSQPAPAPVATVNQNLIDLIATKQRYHGFEDKTTSALSFDNATKTLSITGTDFIVWNNGSRLLKSTEAKQSASNTPGTWYFYYDSSNNNLFTFSSNPWSRSSDIPVAIVEWDGMAGVLKDMRYSCFNVNHILLERENDLAHPAEDIYPDYSKFNKILSFEDTTLQKALETLDQHKHYQLYQPDLVNPFVYTRVDAGVPTLHIDGNLRQMGPAYEAHLQKLFSAGDQLTLRDGAIAGLVDGSYAGIRAKLYDGVHDGSLVFDNLGIARVGDVGSEQAIATRIETPNNNYLAKWDAANLRLDFISQDTFATKIHNLIDPVNHPVTGLTAGHFLKALTDTTYGFAAHGLTYSDVGAQAAHANLTSLSALTYASDSFVKMTGANTFALDTTTYLASSLKGSANGLAELDANGFVKNTQLPSYVDDVLEYGLFINLPAVGESGKIYVITDPSDLEHYNKTYRWSGTVYTIISDTIALGETSSTAFRGDRGKIAYDHTFLTNNPHSVTPAQLGLVIGTDVLAYRTFGSAANSATTDFAPASTVSFPGFGITHALAAYGDHNHSGVYQPVGNYLTAETDPVFSAWNKSTGISIIKSQISDFPTALSAFTNDLGNYGGFSLASDLTAHAALTTTAHGLGASAFHAEGYYQVAGSYAPASGSGNYIQNQNASAQVANLWISGTGKFNGLLYAFGNNAGSNQFRLGHNNETDYYDLGRDNVTTGDFIISSNLNANIFRLTSSGAATFASTVSATQFQSTVATGTPPLTVASTTMVSNLNADMLDGQHGSYYQPLLTNPTTGIGTINYVPKWTGTGTLGNSLIYDDGTNVGIETTNPVEKLDVNGDIAIKNRIYPRVAGTDIAISNRNGNILFNNTSGIEWARITSNGNFGFGITPLSKFHILGGIGNNLPIGFGGVDNYTVLLQDPTSSAIDVGGSICFAGYKTGTSATGLFGYIKGGKYNSTSGDERGYLSMGVSYNTNGAGMEVMRLNTDGNVKILSNIVSNSPSTGALTVAGGVGVGGSVNAKGLIAGEMASIDGSLLVFNATNDAFLQLGIDGSRGYFMSNYWSTAGPKPLDFFIAGTRIGNPVMTLNANTVTLPNLTASKLVFTDVSKNLTSTGIGTASQFLKADGSVDANTYLTSSDLSGYATQSWVSGQGYVTGTPWTSVGYWYASSHPSTIAGYGITDIPTSLPASDVYAWAKASTKPSYTTTEVTEGTNLYYTEARVAANSAVVANTAKVSFPGFGTTGTTATVGNDVRLSDARTPLAHFHGNITNEGYLGITATIPLITGTGGIIQAGAFGTTAGTFAAGDDSRINNGQTAYDWGNHALAGYVTGTNWTLLMNSASLGRITDTIGFNMIPGTGIQLFNGNNPLWTSITVSAVTNSTSVAGIVPASGAVNNYYYGTNNVGTLGWYALSVGDVSGPASSTAYDIALFSGATGKVIMDSGVSIDTTYKEISAGALYLNGTGTHGATLAITGDGAFSSTVSASNFILSSDRRKKRNIIDYVPTFLDTRYIQFNHIDDLGVLRFGVIADELQQIAPELVSQDIRGYGQVSYTDLLIREVAWLKEQVRILTNRLDGNN